MDTDHIRDHPFYLSCPCPPLFPQRQPTEPRTDSISFAES